VRDGGAPAGFAIPAVVLEIVMLEGSEVCFLLRAKWAAAQTYAAGVGAIYRVGPMQRGGSGRCSGRLHGRRARGESCRVEMVIVVGIVVSEGAEAAIDG
jgi:hypothetical protein